MRLMYALGLFLAAAAPVFAVEYTEMEFEVDGTPDVAHIQKGLAEKMGVDLDEITVTVGDNGKVKVRAPKQEEEEEDDEEDEGGYADAAGEAMEGDDEGGDDEDDEDPLGLDDLSGMGDDEEDVDTYDEDAEPDLDFSDEEDEEDEEDEGYPSHEGTPMAEWSPGQTAGWLLSIEELSDEENEALEDLLAEYILYDVESGKHRPLQGSDFICKKKRLKKVVKDMVEGTEAATAVKMIMKKVKEVRAAEDAVKAEEEEKLRPQREAEEKERLAKKAKELMEEKNKWNGEAMSKWSEEDVYTWLDIAVPGIKKNIKALLKRKFTEIMWDKHLNIYPIPEEGPQKFTGSVLVELKKRALTKKAGWEREEILIADNVATTLLTARDKYVEAWLDANEIGTENDEAFKKIAETYEEEAEEEAEQEKAKPYKESRMKFWVPSQVIEYFQKCCGFNKKQKAALSAQVLDYMIWDDKMGDGKGGHRLLSGVDLLADKEEVLKLLTDVFDGTPAHKCPPKIVKKLRKYMKKEAKRTDWALSEAEEEKLAMAMAPPPPPKNGETAAAEDEGYDGKQMSTWSAKDVNEWLDTVKELSGFAKMDIKKKFKEIKMDEVMNDDEATEVGEFNGQDLEYVKLKHLTTPAAWEKTKFVVQDKPAKTLIEKRDAYRAETEDANELQEAEADEQTKKYKDTPMWDWVHSQARAFFQAMDYKKNVLKAFDSALGDYMMYEDKTGHRLMEGRDFMMTDANIEFLITQIFKEGPAKPHVKKIIADIKAYKEAESDEFKKGRKLHRPIPADDVDHADFEPPKDWQGGSKQDL